MKTQIVKLSTGIGMGILFMVFSFAGHAQDNPCDVTKVNGGGFTTTIQSVVCNPGSNTHTIILRVEHDGCPGPACKELSHYSIEADPGTYSNVSVSVISGGMTYSNIDLGPNLGSDPFDGFKIDGTSGIGDGNAGVFTVTYTLSGGLQAQQTSAKAGGNSQIASFTVSNFESVMTCNGTGCPPVEDCDGDGVPDAEDDYECDPDRAFDNYFPANGNGTLAYEDLWPGQGDYDFNDLICDYRFKMVTNASNELVEIFGTFTIKAFGASLHNGFGFQFPNTNISQADLSASGYELTNGSVVTLGANGLESGQIKPTFIIWDDYFDLMPFPGSGIGVNTTPAASYVTPYTVDLFIEFTGGSYTLNQLDIPNFNPFLIVDLTRGHEIHLPDYEPTSLVDNSLFGQAQDNSIPSQDRYYKTEENLPWGIHITESFAYPKEMIDIVEVYNHFVEWATSGGLSYPSWYQDNPGYRDNSKIY